MELRHALLAQYVSEESDSSGTFTAVGIFHETSAGSYPSKFDSGYLHVVLDGVSGEGEESVSVKIALRLEYPPTDVGHVENVYQKPVDTKGMDTFIGIRLDIKDLVLPAPGRYFFDVSIDGELKQSLRLVAGIASIEEK